MTTVRELLENNGKLWDKIITLGEDKALSSLCRRGGVTCTLYHMTTQKPIMQVTNGPTPLGNRNRDHCTGEIGACGCAHAELIATMWIQAHSTLEGLILLCSYSPCIACANAIALCDRIIGVVYNNPYSGVDGLHILDHNDIPHLQVTECHFLEYDDPDRN